MSLSPHGSQMAAAIRYLPILATNGHIHRFVSGNCYWLGLGVWGWFDGDGGFARAYVCYTWGLHSDIIGGRVRSGRYADEDGVYHCDGDGDTDTGSLCISASGDETIGVAV